MKNIRYRNKYRIPSTRAYWWNYGNNAAYFVTICTRDRVHYFGRVRNTRMELSMIGRVAHQCWVDIPDHFPFVKLGAFVVMPNHVHGIVIIDKPDDVNTGNRDRATTITTTAVETQDFASLRDPCHPTPNPNHPTPNPCHPTPNPNHPTPNPCHPTPNPCHPTAHPNHPTPNPCHPIAAPNKFGPQSRNLGSIIRGYKIGVTKYARNNKLDFAWQPRFHDRIIRDQTAYNNIVTYIMNNPRNWASDEFHP